MGAAARMTLPRPVIGVAVRAYSRYFNVAISEIEPRVHAAGYSSFDAFFTRRLREDARPIDDDADVLVSPCDGRLREFSTISDDGQEVTAKGHAYRLEDLLTDEDLARTFVGGVAATIYLHPRDYHRVHAPCAGHVSRVINVPGRLLPVNDAALQREPRLFACNERMIHVLDTIWGQIAIVMVAAFGVGHMTCAYADVPLHPRELVTRVLAPMVAIEKGDEIGRFHLGSTVVLLLPPGFSPQLAANHVALRFGRPLLRWEKS